MKFKMKIGALGVTVCMVLVIGLYSNCGQQINPLNNAQRTSSNNSSVLSISMSLARVTTSTPNPINVTVTVLSPTGNGSGLTITPTVNRATVGTVTDNGGGSYSFRVTPTITTGEVPITASVTVAGVTAETSKTAVVLPTIDPAWGQPEAVPGYVNTLGYEDGPEISQDGQWLLVTDYSPMDVLQCIMADGSNPNASSCKTAIGPYSGEIRPNFPGASRILSSGTALRNRCPSICFTSDGTGSGGDITSTALAPISAYVFKRQADGSFKEPKVIAYSADGCSHLMGLSFLSSPSADGAAQVIFAYELPYNGSGHTHKVQYAPINVTTDTTLGVYSCTGVWTHSISGSIVTDLTAEGSPDLGNPNANGGRFLWIDDEDHGDLRYRVINGTLPTASLSAEANVAYPVPGNARRMPFFHGATNTLYYSENNYAIKSRVLSGTTQSTANGATWGSAQTILSNGADHGSAITDRIIAVGEPSLADLPNSGGRELYFAYVLKTATGVNNNVARVKMN